MIKPRAPLDEYARWCIGEAPDCIVAWWLVTSYLYYVRDISLITDGYYDELCRELAARWDAIEHPHKHLIERRALGAGTGFYLAEGAYPRMVVGAAEVLLAYGAPNLPAGRDEPAARVPAPIINAKPQGDLFA